MKNINKQRKASMMVLSFAMVIAIYLNWQYAKGAQDSYIVTDELTEYMNAEIDMEQSMQAV